MWFILTWGKVLVMWTNMGKALVSRLFSDYSQHFSDIFQCFSDISWAFLRHYSEYSQCFSDYSQAFRGLFSYYSWLFSDYSQRFSGISRLWFSCSCHLPGSLYRICCNFLSARISGITSSSLCRQRILTDTTAWLICALCSTNVEKVAAGLVRTWVMAWVNSWW